MDSGGGIVQYFPMEGKVMTPIEMEIVDEDEMAAIELALSQAEQNASQASQEDSKEGEGSEGMEHRQGTALPLAEGEAAGAKDAKKTQRFRLSNAAYEVIRAAVVETQGAALGSLCGDKVAELRARVVAASPQAASLSDAEWATWLKRQWKTAGMKKAKEQVQGEEAAGAAEAEDSRGSTCGGMETPGKKRRAPMEEQSKDTKKHRMRQTTLSEMMAGACASQENSTVQTKVKEVMMGKGEEAAKDEVGGRAEVEVQKGGGEMKAGGAEVKAGGEAWSVRQEGEEDASLLRELLDESRREWQETEQDLRQQLHAARKEAEELREAVEAGEARIEWQEAQHSESMTEVVVRGQRIGELEAMLGQAKPPRPSGAAWYSQAGEGVVVKEEKDAIRVKKEKETVTAGVQVKTEAEARHPGREGVSVKVEKEGIKVKVEKGAEAQRGSEGGDAPKSVLEESRKEWNDKEKALLQQVEMLKREVDRCGAEQSLRNQEAADAYKRLEEVSRAEVERVKKAHEKEVVELRCEMVDAGGGKKGKIEVDLEAIPRVSATMSVSALKAEFRARGDHAKKMHRGFGQWGVDHFVRELVEGTSCVSATREFRYVEQLSGLIRKQTAEKEQEQQARRIEEQKIAERERLERQKAELERLRKHEEALHTHESLCHCCPLAPTNKLSIGFLSRHQQPDLRCSVCDRQNSYQNSLEVLWTCQKCDYDICADCYRVESLPEDQRKKKRAEVAKEKAKLEKQRQIERKKEIVRRQAEEKKREAERQKEEKEMLKQIGGPFPDKIMNPTAKNRGRNGSGKGFRVLQSEGYDYDGWHSYCGPPGPELDSFWATEEEAVQRASYLFYEENVWGLCLEEMLDYQDDVDTRCTMAEVFRLSVCPPDSCRWTVTVVRG